MKPLTALQEGLSTMGPDSSLQRLLKADELARRLNCGKSTIYRLAQTGQIPAIGIGSTGVRFDLQAVLEALRRK